MKTLLPTHRLPRDNLPLAIDLDGTLIFTDTFHEMMSRLLKKTPWLLFCLPFWFLKGRPYAKRRLSRAVGIDPSLLPYHKELLEALRQEKLKGRHLVLATGTNQEIALKVADFLGIFDEVIASDDHINMTGQNKRAQLVQRFDVKGYHYVGDAPVDYAVWLDAKKAIIVNPKPGAVKAALKALSPQGIILYSTLQNRWKTWWQALRPERILCNLPILVMQTFGETSMFLSLCFISLASYLLSQLLFLDNNRRQVSEVSSPFTTGQLQLIMGFILEVVCFVIGFGLAIKNGLYFLLSVFLFHIFLTVAYGIENRLHKLSIWIIHITLIVLIF